MLRYALRITDVYGTRATVALFPTKREALIAARRYSVYGVTIEVVRVTK